MYLYFARVDDFEEEIILGAAYCEGDYLSAV
jgi:hypothetical protein